jgi:hypothetical protein
MLGPFGYHSAQGVGLNPEKKIGLRFAGGSKSLLRNGRFSSMWPVIEAGTARRRNIITILSSKYITKI